MTIATGLLVAIVPAKSKAATLSTDFLFGTSPVSVASAAYDGNPADFANVFITNTFTSSNAFDAGLGTLTAVNVSVSTSYTVTSSAVINFPLTMNFVQLLGAPFAGASNTLNTSVTLNTPAGGTGLFAGTILDTYSLPTISDQLALALFSQPSLVTSKISFNEAGLVVPLSSIALTGDAQITYTYTPVAATPLPAALPLFASALAAVGLVGWRRKRKVAAGPRQMAV